MKQRLQKIMASSGLASRREAERWIEAGRVTVNGRVASLGESADPGRDRIAVDGRPLKTEEDKVCVLLHKPVGYVTTMRDPQGRPVVAELVRDIPLRLFPVGRLDLNTSGLLLLTNDGDLANHLAHPRHNVDKVYLARIRGVLSPAQADLLARGVRLEDGVTAPAKVERVRQAGSHSWVKITIHEGRNRQVRRMFEAVGHPVSRLQRLQVGFLELGALAPGRYRKLSRQEIVRLKEL